MLLILAAALAMAVANSAFSEVYLDAIVDNLASRFDAQRELIATDVMATLEDLSTRGAVQL